MNTLFKLEAFEPLEDQTDYTTFGKYETDKDGNVLIRHSDVGIYDSIENAEQMIQKLIVQKAKENRSGFGGWTMYFGFVVTEMQVNPDIDRYGNIPTFESQRSYLADGTLNCISDLDDNCTKQFAGRKVPIKIKNGEFCYQLTSDKLIPVILYAAPYTEEEWKSHFADGVTGDFTDDSGMVYEVGWGHNHVFSPFLFPESNLAGCGISDSMKVALLKEQENPSDGI